MKTSQPHPLAVDAARTAAPFSDTSHAAELIDRTCRVSEREQLLAECRPLIDALTRSGVNADVRERAAALLARLDARDPANAAAEARVRKIDLTDAEWRELAGES